MGQRQSCVDNFINMKFMYITERLQLVHTAVWYQTLITVVERLENVTPCIQIPSTQENLFMLHYYVPLREMRSAGNSINVLNDIALYFLLGSILKYF